MALPASSTPKPASGQPAFPSREISSTLRNWWDNEVDFEKSLGDPFGDPNKKGGTVFDLQPEVSSLQAVKVLLELEEIVGFELPDGMVKQGGYSTKEEFVRHLSGQVQTKWDLQNKSSKK